MYAYHHGFPVWKVTGTRRLYHPLCGTIWTVKGDPGDRKSFKVFNRHLDMGAPTSACNSGRVGGSCLAQKPIEYICSLRVAAWLSSHRTMELIHQGRTPFAQAL